jgi:hypothetical protein
MKSSEIREKIREVFPNARNIWLTDKEYFIPKFEDVLRRVAVNWPNVKYGGPKSECEDFALFLHAAIKHQDIESDQEYNTAFGECIERTVLGGVHALNIVICQEGVFLIDPTNRSVRNPNNDDVFFVKM